MALTQVTGPYPIFTDLDGSPLDDGYLYIGSTNEDPEVNPIQVYWDSALTIPATQPIRTNNGYAWRNGTPALIYTAGQFSITIRNKRGEFVLYSPVGYGFDPAAVSASVVKNDFTGDGVTVDFTLSASPSTKLATSVFINGVYQEKDSYSILGNVLTFTVAPPLSSSVEVMTNETGVIGTTNASLVSYTAGFAGAVAQTVQTKLEQYVSVKDFGAVGDGVTDDTAAIQAALSSGALFVTIPESSTDYRIGDTIDIPAGVTLSGYGASVQALATKTGNLNALGRHFNLNSNSRLLGVKIKPAAGTYSYNPAAYHQVVAMNGTTPLVRDLHVDTTGALATDFLNSIQVMTGAVGAIIESCVSVNGSIQYGTGNATSTLVKNVEIYNAIGNALTASGDTNGTYYGHIIDGFYIVDPARMGIEDYSRQFNTPPQILSGSVIQNGKIVCTGAVTPLYFAVSAVSLMPRISNVHIVNWPKDYAIELMGGCGASVSGCTVEWTDGNPNNVRAVQIQSNTGTFNYGVTVENNLFIRAYEGILARYGKLIAANNTFVDPKRSGISDEVTGTGRGSQIIGNRFVAKSPNATTRFMISIQNQSAVSGNFIEYQSSATGGSNQEWAIVVGGSNSVITGNYVQDNGVVSGASAPYFALTNGSTPSNVRIIGNTCTGSTRVNYQLFVDLIAEYNVIPGSVTGGSNVKLGFFNKTPIRASGWSTPTGTATRTTFDTATVTTEQLAQRVKALIDDLHATAGYGLLQS